MTPEQEEQVRRALASVPRESAPPPDVAARLDATLSRLVAERGVVDGAPADVEQPVSPRVDELERRRRRRWPRVLVAAASVAVLAYGVGAFVDGLGVSGGDAASTAARDETSAGGQAESGGQAAPDAPGVLPQLNGTDSLGGVAPPTPDSGKAAYARALTTRTVRLHRDTLSADVRRLLDRRTIADGRTLRPDSAGEARSPATLLAPCTAPATAGGDRLAAARLDGTRATLVVRRGTDGTRVAEVYACDDPARLLAVAQLGGVR